MSPLIVAMLVAGSVCASTGTLLLKMGATGRSRPLEFINPYVLLGLAAYFLGAILWVFSMSKAPLTVVYSFTALTYVLVLLAAIIFQGERPSAINLVGILTVLTGIILVLWGRQ